tara:strand:+ start:615 stop:851 length:237 start_codon:yes stop_codon:yes gene_type:complete
MNQLNELLIPILERLTNIEKSIGNNKVPNLMTIKQVIEYSQLSQSTIRRSLLKGTLKPFKDEGKKLFRKSDVDRWLNS